LDQPVGHPKKQKYEVFLGQLPAQYLDFGARVNSLKTRCF